MPCQVQCARPAQGLHSARRATEAGELGALLQGGKPLLARQTLHHSASKHFLPIPQSVPAAVRCVCPDAHSGVVPRGLLPVNIGTPGDKVQATFRVGTDGDDALPLQVPHEVGGGIMGRERGEDELKLASGMLVGASGLHLQ